jgi:inorganic pyrophosphatase
MKTISLLFILILITSCAEPERKETKSTASLHLLNDIAPFTSDSLVHVVVEIPAGTNQKWEVNKENGQVEWQQITADSFRTVEYLPYPANYGFIPQTLLPKETGGDGDPVDIFVLGPAVERSSIVPARIIGIIHMLDDNESDSKLLAVQADAPGLSARSLEELKNRYPGIVDILQLWLANYKGPGEVEIQSIGNEAEAMRYLKQAVADFPEKSGK